MVIAIDGLSSCGKSTLAKDLADDLGYTYVDSGAMYRAVTLFFLDNQVNIHDSNSVEKALDMIDISWQSNQLILNGQDVSETIRNPRIAEFVSPVAAISQVRKKLVEIQQACGSTGNIVMDGRDIGTVVFPNAEIKLFVTADIEERTARRYAELLDKGIQINKAEVQANLSERDRIDSTRLDSPLKQAEEAHILDTTDLTRSGQLGVALDIILRHTAITKK